MSKKAVKCTQCGKILFYTDKTNKGAIAHEVEKRGGVAKLPVLFGCSDWVFTCDKECWRKWRDENIPKEKLEEGEKVCKKMREEMMSEDFQNGLCEGLQCISNIFNRRKYSK